MTVETPEVVHRQDARASNTGAGAPSGTSSSSSSASAGDSSGSSGSSSSSGASDVPGTKALSHLVVIPTYNEAESLPKIVESTLAVAKDEAAAQNFRQVDILIVDDNSPDGTGKIADGMAQRNSNVHVLHRKSKDGLGKAYIAGFKWALARDYDVISEMDADYSHDPRFLPSFWKELHRYDVVVGSRRIEGGGTINWGIARQVISMGGSIYARILLGMPIKDMTGGYNAWRREVLESVDLDAITSSGYAFQIELKWRAWRKGYSLVETPIVFEDRAVGKSKMSKKIILEGFLKVLALRLNL